MTTTIKTIAAAIIPLAARMSVLGCRRSDCRRGTRRWIRAGTDAGNRPRAGPPPTSRITGASSAPSSPRRSISQRYSDVSRRTVSDLLLFSSPEPSQPWLAFRDVLTVDGAPVDDRPARLAELLRSSPEVSGERWERLVEESARFNIGPIFRNLNAPTSALQLLTVTDQPRASFTVRGEQHVGGVSHLGRRFPGTDLAGLDQGPREPRALRARHVLDRA